MRIFRPLLAVLTALCGVAVGATAFLLGFASSDVPFLGRAALLAVGACAFFVALLPKQVDRWAGVVIVVGLSSMIGLGIATISVNFGRFVGFGILFYLLPAAGLTVLLAVARFFTRRNLTERNEKPVLIQKS